ncbi:hypothetical protein [Streptomyces sp. NPDC001380]|uniref:hypothetical protein n=1 Tax=Streptomyces sp. NPDC001380 TaxID=3364566 RepID=UPI0036B4FBC7
MEHPDAPELGTALVHITAADPAHAEVVARFLEDAFGGTRPVSYPLPGRDGARLELVVDVVGVGLPPLAEA